MDEGLSIGELAGRAGVSVRALRLYEASGLLKPLRTAAGRRVYGAGEVARLGQVMALKRAGFTLKRIGELVGAKGLLDPRRLVEAQIAALRTSPARWSAGSPACAPPRLSSITEVRSTSPPSAS